jgi:hypothetical protein
MESDVPRLVLSDAARAQVWEVLVRALKRKDPGRHIRVVRDTEQSTRLVAPKNG